MASESGNGADKTVWNHTIVAPAEGIAGISVYRYVEMAGIPSDLQTGDPLRTWLPLGVAVLCFLPQGRLFFA